MPRPERAEIKAKCSSAPREEKKGGKKGNRKKRLHVLHPGNPMVMGQNEWVKWEEERRGGGDLQNGFSLKGRETPAGMGYKRGSGRQGGPARDEGACILHEGKGRLGGKNKRGQKNGGERQGKS